MNTPPTLRAGLAQMAPVFLDRGATLEKVAQWCRDAAAQGCGLVAFGETLVPGYPVWLSRTDGARFDDPGQKEMHARYLEQAVQIERGDLEPVAAVARAHDLTVVLGVAERPKDRGGHSVYCSAVVLGPDGAVAAVHRKLMPTHEERLCWAIGDGAGLVTHPAGPFQLGVLNCWENWMPLARTALYAAGEDLHVSLWPGSPENTRDLTRFAAREGRSYVLSVCGLLRPEDVPPDTPLRERLLAQGEAFLLPGGSAAAAPDGSWLQEPVAEREALLVIDLDPRRVREERQSFDPAGHYARPDVLRLRVDRRRQGTLEDD